MQLVPPSKKPLKFRFEGIILDRVRHDEALVELAQERGAKYLVGTRVVAVTGTKVTLKDGRELSAKIIVGAGEKTRNRIIVTICSSEHDDRRPHA